MMSGCALLIVSKILLLETLYLLIVVIESQKIKIRIPKKSIMK
jgi:hypothetical protein